MYAVTTRSSVRDVLDCCAWAEKARAVAVKTKIEPMTASLFTCESSLHFEIAQRHALIELFVLDVKLNVVITRSRNSELGDVYSCHFSDPAHRLRGYLR